MHQTAVLPSLLIVLSHQVAFAQTPVAPPPAPSPVAPAAEPAQPTPPAEPAPAAEAPADATAAATAPAPLPVEDTTLAGAPIEEEAPKGKVDRVAVGEEGFLQPGALLQAWFFLTNQDSTTTSTFRIRRAELSIKGEIAPDLVGYKLMIDPAKLLKFGTDTTPVLDAAGDPVASGDQVEISTPPDDTAVLQDVSVTFLSEYVEVSIGQFKVPVSYEGFNSSSKLLFPERALVSRAFGDRRDIGLRFDKKFEYFGYNAGIYNGNGLNKIDQNNQKDIALRLEAYPIKGITIGAVGYTSVGSRNDPVTKDRLEGDLKLELSDAVLQVEYIHAWDGPRGSRVEGHGLYVAGGYTFFERLQPLVRIGFVDPDADTADTEINAYELGVNYYLRKHLAKLQLSFGIFDPTTPATKSRQELTVSTQLSF